MSEDPADGDKDEDDKAEVSKEQFLKDFFKTFKAEEQSIRDALACVNSEVHEQLDALLLRLQALEASFTRQAHVLPAYDVQQYRSSLKALTEELAARREQLAPRKKFSFKRRNPPPVATTGEDKGYVLPASADSDPSSAFHGERLDGLANQLVIRKPGELEGRDVWLSNLEGCRIILLDRIGALHVHKLKQCEVVVAAVSSSAMMHHCSRCVFTLAVKQLRLHDSDAVALHLHSLSGPIIEHCQHVAFAPNDLHWPEVPELLQQASLGVKAEASAWSEVQDFNWLKRQASPNWRAVPSGQRRQSLEWQSAEEVLRHFQDEPLPPALPELMLYESCWDSTDATVDEF